MSIDLLVFTSIEDIFYLYYTYEQSIGKKPLYSNTQGLKIKKILEMNGNVVLAPCQKIQDLQNCECCTFSTLLL